MTRSRTRVVGWRRTTVNGRHGLPEEMRHLQDVRGFGCVQSQRTAESKESSRKGRNKNSDAVEDNAAAKWYMPITPNRRMPTP